jgi:hypothetical protein
MGIKWSTIVYGKDGLCEPSFGLNRDLVLLLPCLAQIIEHVS